MIASLYPFIQCVYDYKFWRSGSFLTYDYSLDFDIYANKYKKKSKDGYFSYFNVVFGIYSACLYADLNIPIRFMGSIHEFKF